MPEAGASAKSSAMSSPRIGSLDLARTLGFDFERGADDPDIVRIRLKL